MVDKDLVDVVGIIGLGAMGTAYARRLIDSGLDVCGFDPSGDARERLTDMGGHAMLSADDVARRCPVIVSALPTRGAFDDVLNVLTANPTESGWVIDTNTLPGGVKFAASDDLATTGWVMLDCAVSGNPAMVLDDTYSFYVSGEGRHAGAVRAVIGALATKVFDVGEFGNATKAKLIINHLLMIHNAAAAEAITLAAKVGLEPERVYELVVASGGSSRMFEVRGKWMVTGEYPKANVYEILLDKDGVAIADLARSVRHPVPLFANAYQSHMIGLAQGWHEYDASSMEAVYANLSGDTRVPGS